MRPRLRAVARRVNERMPLGMRTRFTRAALFSGLHAVTTIGLLGYGMVGSSARFDGFRPPQGSELAGNIAEILMLPASWLWTPWASRHLSNTVEWLLFLGTSILWGLVLSACYERVRTRSNSSTRQT
jgi:hypothetical protein